MGYGGTVQTRHRNQYANTAQRMRSRFANTTMKSSNTVSSPAATLAAALAGKPVVAAAGAPRPVVTTAVRWQANPATVAAILAYAAQNSNMACKRHFGCSAHFVGALRQAHGVAGYVAPKAAKVAKVAKVVGGSIL